MGAGLALFLDSALRIAAMTVAGALLGSSSFADQVVTNFSDGGPGSLRQAILNAAPGDTIWFDGWSGQSILLTSGELAISGGLTIVGPTNAPQPGGALIINAVGASRAFHFLDGTNALVNLAVFGGYSSNAGGGILNEASSSLTLSQCTMGNSSSGDGGGGVASFGNLTVAACTLAGNVAATLGGGIYISNAVLAVTNSTLANNQSLQGGGVFNSGGFEAIQNCTIAFNTAWATGGGLSSADNPSSDATNVVGSTVVAENDATNNPDLDGTFISAGFNLIGIYTGGGNFDPTNDDLPGTVTTPLNPELGPLADNGGPTMTMALMTNSPALDQGNAGALSFDQRGFPRKFDYLRLTFPPGGDGSDIGAFELSPPSPFLSVAFSGGNVLVSWPTNSPEFRLQYSTNFPPNGPWVDWTGPLIIMAGQYVATDSSPTNVCYFRLIAPSVVPGCLTANVATLPATRPALDSAILNGSVVPGCSTNLISWFQFGPTTGYGENTPIQLLAAATNPVPVSFFAADLTPGALYHFRFVVSDGNGASFGQDQSFTLPLAPLAVTLEATLVTSNTAVLNAAFNPVGAPTFGWFNVFTVNPPSNGVTTAQSLGNDVNPTNVSLALAGLNPGTTYYFQAMCSNVFASSSGFTIAFTTPQAPAVISNAITAENMLPGTTDWMMTNPVSVGPGTNQGDREWPTLRTHAIEGYASATSVNLGDWLTFYVSTTSPTFSLEIFRMGYYGGLGGRRMTNACWSGLPGSDQPTPPTQPNGLIECNWQPTFLTAATNGSFQIPQDWVSGVYVAKLTASSGKQSYIIFVVRDDSRNSDFLVQSSVTTYQAYNQWGGKSIYFGVSNNVIDVPSLAASCVSFDRPYMTGSNPDAAYGNGAGHFFTWEKLPDADTQEPATWEYNMVRWLESEGYDVTYCTDIDVDRDPNLLLSHQAFMSVGHDEYWSPTARTNVESARDLGIHLAFFSGNTVWNRVFFSPDSQGNPSRSMTFAESYWVIGWFPESLVGGTWTGNGDEDLAATAQCPAWLSDQTSLVNGTTVGNHIAGPEVNGWVIEPGEVSSELVPPDTRIVFSGVGITADSIWYTAQTSGATVFSAATIQWSWGLDAFTVNGVREILPPRSERVSTDVQQVTRNVLRRFQDATRMSADLPDGEYTLQSANSYPSFLICDDQGASNAPVDLSPGDGWTPTNNQAVWIVARYTGDRPPCVGPYKAAADAWYTIRNAQNGQTLIVGDGGITNGPVMVVGDSSGNWGQPPDNLQQLWRIWHYTANNDNWYLFQNVASGQLLIAPNSSTPAPPVAVYGDNGGWGETEEDLQKMWILTPQ